MTSPALTKKQLRDAQESARRASLALNTPDLHLYQWGGKKRDRLVLRTHSTTRFLKRWGAA